MKPLSLSTALVIVLVLLSQAADIKAQSLDEDPTGSTQATTPEPDGYDVILLAGQSNMAGRGLLSTTDPDAAVDGRIFMWHPISGIVPAQDPLVHQEQRKAGTAGLGLTFAKAYLKTIPSNRKVLLVGAAYGGTSFIEDVTAYTAQWNFTRQTFENVPNLHHRWIATSDPDIGGDLYRGAVRRANDAMAAAGSGGRFAGILWHQGESDAVHGGADAYASNHRNLINALRANITGANSATPVVVGELNPCFLAACPARTGAQPTAETFQKILHYFHTLRDNVPYTAFVSSAGLGWMSDGTHFDLASVRELGKRYAAKLFEAKYNLPQPAVDFKIYSGKYFNVGGAIDNDPISVTTNGNVTAMSAVNLVQSAVHGMVVRIDDSLGSLALKVDGALLNGSYTKSGWIKLASTSYANNLVSALNQTQRHHLYVSGGKPAAGHGSSTTVTYVQSPSAIPVNTWAHVAVTYDSTTQTMRLYVNGEPVSYAQGVPPAPPATGIVDLQLSRYGYATTGYGIDGHMIDNRVYKKALSATQVAAIYKFESMYRSGY